MHLSDEQIQRTLDGELAPQDVAPVREHTAECAACRAAIEQARTDAQAIDVLLLQLDHRPPGTSTATIMNHVRPRSWRWMQYAAALSLITLGGVAWAAPGSPLPAMVQQLASLMRGVPQREATLKAVARPLAPDAPPPVSAGPPGLSGVTVAPERHLVIMFASAESGGEVRIALTDDDELTVRAPTGSAEFTSTDGRLVVTPTGREPRTAIVFEIAIPRRAPHVEVRVRGRRIFRSDLGGVRAAVAPTSGRYVLPLQ